MSSLTVERKPSRRSGLPAAECVPASANLKPKEHGAYAILGIPIATSLIIGGPTLVGVCVAVAAFAGFFAHEPLLITLGHRGSRAQRETPAARKWLFLLLALTVICGCVALAAGSFAVRCSLLMCGLLAASSFALAIAGKHKTMIGQLWGVVGLSVPCVPILLAGEFATQVTLEAWGTWLIGFAATTMAVRGVIAAQKRKSRTVHWFAVTALTSLISGLAACEMTLPLASLPMLFMSWYLMFDPPHATQLKRIGWTLVGGTVASAIWLIIIMTYLQTAVERGSVPIGSQVGYRCDLSRQSQWHP